MIVEINSLIKDSPPKSIQRLVLGLSAGALPLMKRLKARNHVDHLVLTTGAASSLEDSLDGVLIGSLSEIIPKFWIKGGLLIFIGAVGAVVRLVNPFLRSKDLDPAVLVMDSKGLNIIPLLGGHIGGAESLAQELAEDLGAKSIFTSDSKNNQRIPLDSFGKSWGWKRSGSLDNWKQLMIRQAKGEVIQVRQFSGIDLWQSMDAASNCLFDLKSEEPNKEVDLNIGSKVNDGCSWHPSILWIGIGCERNTTQNLLSRAIDDSFKAAGLAKESIAGIATIDIKSNENGLIELIEAHQWFINFYSAEDLSKIKVPNPSAKVLQEIGSSSVAEASALKAAGVNSELIFEKHIYHSTDGELGAVTIAIAESDHSFAPSQGELHLIGSGPGEIAFLTNDARFALSRSAIWIGYGLYLDLLEPLRRDDQLRLNGKLTFEHDRCKKALELASQGARVALISSGDSGIYGMAGLALELWLELSDNERPLLQVHPGISALQMAAAKTGAPLMDDFCSISLSDLLTPWEKIEERLECAARGDFVIAIYNPRSQKRSWQLGRAIDILINYRSKSTPIALCRQLSREEEVVEIFTFDSLPIEKIDMLSVLVIGNSQSFMKDSVLITPRGYSLN